MVREEKLKQWVKEKMEEGVSEERIRKSLEETGHDPSVVDRVQNPFHEKEEEEEKDQHEKFQERGQERDGLKYGESPFEKDSETDSRQNTESKQSRENDQPEKEEYKRPDTSGIRSPEKNSGKEKKDSGLDLDLDFDFEMPDISRRMALGAAALLLLLVAGGALYSYGLPSNLVPSGDIQTSPSDVSTSSQGSPTQNCDVGVRINDLYRESGTTFVDVQVFNGRANTTLELYDQDGMVASQSRSVEGASTFQFSESGYLAVFKPIGCGFEDRYTTG